MNEDINILYFGGSGGFYFLHQLLIDSTNYAWFPDKNNKDKNFNNIRYKNFNINFNNWKETEIWPDNKMTFLSKSKKRKIYFFCEDIENWKRNDGKKVVLYTDLKSQIRLCLFKKASWFGYEKINNFLQIKKILQSNKKENVESFYSVISESNCFIKFQDLLKQETLQKILLELNCDFNEKNIEFMNYYKSLHPPLLLKKIGIEI